MKFEALGLLSWSLISFTFPELPKEKKKKKGLTLVLVARIMLAKYYLQCQNMEDMCTVTSQ